MCSSVSLLRRRFRARYDDVRCGTGNQRGMPAAKRKKDDSKLCKSGNISGYFSIKVGPIKGARVAWPKKSLIRDLMILC
jgi:hypothetical protein